MASSNWPVVTSANARRLRATRWSSALPPRPRPVPLPSHSMAEAKSRSSKAQTPRITQPGPASGFSARKRSKAAFASAHRFDS